MAITSPMKLSLTSSDYEETNGEYLLSRPILILASQSIIVADLGVLKGWAKKNFTRSARGKERQR